MLAVQKTLESTRIIFKSLESNEEKKIHNRPHQLFKRKANKCLFHGAQLFFCCLIKGFCLFGVLCGFLYCCFGFGLWGVLFVDVWFSPVLRAQGHIAELAYLQSQCSRRGSVPCGKEEWVAPATCLPNSRSMSNGAHLGAVTTVSHPVRSSERNTQVELLTNSLSDNIAGLASASTLFSLVTSMAELLYFQMVQTHKGCKH